MEQKLYYLDALSSCANNNTGCELEFPDDLKVLLESGWRIIQVSAFGYFPTRNIQEKCILLLQRD